MPAYCGFELAALKIARLALSTQMSIARRTSVSVAVSEASREPAAELGLDERGGHAAGHLAGVVAAHAVGQHHQRGRLVDDDRVLVVVARPAGVRGAVELERHHRHGRGGGDRSTRRIVPDPASAHRASADALGAATMLQPLADSDDRDRADRTEHAARRAARWPVNQVASAGSVTSISPASQPSRAAPSVMMIGKRSISFISSVLPKMISGIDDRQADDQQRSMSALGGRGDGDHVVQAHHQVGDAGWCGSPPAMRARLP